MMIDGSIPEDPIQQRREQREKKRAYELYTAARKVHETAEYHLKCAEKELQRPEMGYPDKTSYIDHHITRAAENIWLRRGIEKRDEISQPEENTPAYHNVF